MTGGSIRKEDLVDADVVDEVELRSAEGAGDSYITGVTVVSTTSGTKRVVVSGYSTTNMDTPLEVGDKVIIAGNAAAGTYTVNSIIDAVTFDVVEAIVTAGAGTVAFRNPAGARKVGVNPVRLLHSVNTILQDVLGDIDVGTYIDFLLENDPPVPTNNYAVTRSGGGVVTTETWKRADTTLIRSVDYTRSAGVVTQEVRKVFAVDGTTIIGQLTVVYTRSQGVVTSASCTRNV